ncbi:MAG: transglutaminase domain-containing protein [Candidatus Omnitrophica bacterium]|nr:transglutaminase domain-containing protein [Candidatus Omnitrophota bacterium]
MTKKYLNIAIVLFFAWTVYGYCQNDMSLRDLAAFVMMSAFLLRLRTGQKHYSFFGHIPLSVIFVSSILAGFAWRSVYPPPEEAISPFPAVTAALQSGTIFASLLIWLKPFTEKNLYSLFSLAWATAALSINVPFDSARLMIFCSFCIIAIAVVILFSMHKPKEPKRVFRYYRDFIVFSVLIIMLSTGLFYMIAKTIVIFDQAFMNLISDYVMPRSYTHFLKIEPFMKLSNPGRSAWDKRPVLEVQAPNVYGIYLKTQIFDDFNNGVWAELEDIKKFPLPDNLPVDSPKVNMTMFTSFEHIVPSPYSVSAAKGNMPFTKSHDGIVYTEDDQRTRILTFALASKNVPVRLSPAQFEQFTAIPADIASDLKEISSQIVSDENDPTAQANLLSGYFHENFRYSLYVNFRGDNKGLISMIREHRPAYCTYFASAFAMLLRAQGIPARVATGFLADEKIDKKRNVFLARIYDAHAWVEVLLKDTDPKTGLTRDRWLIMDPTPAGERINALKETGINFSKIAENAWLSILRFSAFIENLDKEKLKQNTLLALILFMLIMNSKKIILRLRELAISIHKKTAVIKSRSDPLQLIYRRYEQYLKTSFGEMRKPPDTDQEVISRLKSQPRAPAGAIAKMESFVGQYHAARFGLRKDIDLEKTIRNIEKDAEGPKRQLQIKSPNPRVKAEVPIKGHEGLHDGQESQEHKI